MQRKIVIYFKEFIVDLKSMVEYSSFTLAIISIAMFLTPVIHRFDVALSTALAFYYIFLRPFVKDTGDFYVFRLIASASLRRAILFFIVFKLLLRDKSAVYTGQKFVYYTAIMTFIMIAYLILRNILICRKRRREEQAIEDFMYDDRIYTFTQDRNSAGSMSYFEYRRNLDRLLSKEEDCMDEIEKKYNILKSKLNSEISNEAEILNIIEEAFSGVKNFRSSRKIN